MSTIIKSSSELRKNYNTISYICRKTKTPVFLTKNGTGDTVIMDLETFNQREDDLETSERLFATERSRMLGSQGQPIDAFEKNMREAIAKGAEHYQLTNQHQHPNEHAHPHQFPDNSNARRVYNE